MQNTLRLLATLLISGLACIGCHMYPLHKPAQHVMVPPALRCKHTYCEKPVPLHIPHDYCIEHTVKRLQTQYERTGQLPRIP